MASILVIHGPNLNLLGKREPELYGSATLAEIDANIRKLSTNHHIETFQSNHEGDIIDLIQTIDGKYNYLIINPAGLGHTSIAIRDALLCINVPFIEVHLTNVFQREEFRQVSFTMDVAKGIICGLGAQGYYLAIQAACNHLEK